MEFWKNLLVKPTDTIGKAIRVIDTGSAQISLVVNDDRHLLGTVTDGDVRRGLLRSVPLDAPVSTVMNQDPVVGRPHQARDAYRHIMRSHVLRHLPLVDSAGQLVGLALLDGYEVAEQEVRENWVVLMAGGDGSRLRPLTENLPKPLVKVRKKPLLEWTVESFLEHNFRNFFISVNYKAEMIKDRFGSGAKWGANIRYLEEKNRLGTAGALGLIDPRPEEPILVMNGDVLTTVNFGSLLEFHIEQGARATMCVRPYDFQIPFGVVKTKHMRITAIDEKPVQQVFVNAGIYVLDPGVLDFIPRERPIDMPDLFQLLIEARHETTVFPIREYWLDVGRMDDLQRANDEFLENFEPD